MTVIRRSKSWRTVTWLITLAVVASLVPIAVAPGAAQTVEEARKFLVLPAEDQSGSGVRYLSRDLTDEVVLALAAKSGVAGAEFRANSPQVRRAVAEGRLLSVQVEAKAQSPAAAVLVGHALKMDAVMMLTIESVVTTESPRQAKVGVSGEIYSVAANFNEQAGEAVPSPQAERTFNVIGASQEVAGYDRSDQPLIREAMRDAARQIAATAAGEEAVPVQPARKKSGWKWIGVLIGVGVLAALVGNKGSGNQASAGALPPVSLTLKVEANGIRLLWAPPPAGDLIVNSYEIQRSLDGAPWQYIAGGAMLNAGATEWFDDNLVTGAYRYRISALYTDQAQSPWAYFNQISYTQ